MTGPLEVPEPGAARLFEDRTQRRLVLTRERAVGVGAAFAHEQRVVRAQVAPVLLADERALHDLVRAGRRELAHDADVAGPPLRPDLGRGVDERRERPRVERGSFA